MKLKNIWRLTRLGGESFLAAWALMLAGQLQTGNILTGIFFLFCFLFIRYSVRIYQKQIVSVASALSAVSGTLAALFALLYMAVDGANYIRALENRLFQGVVWLAAALGFFFLFFHLLRLIFINLLKKEKWQTFLTRRTLASPSCPSSPPSPSSPSCPSSLPSPSSPLSSSSPPSPSSRLTARIVGTYRRHLGKITFVICLLGFLPWFLYLYPGILTPDSLNQLKQALGQASYSNHHPFVHTMLIKLFCQIGLLFTDNLTIAVSGYTIFQMVVLSLTAAYLVTTFRRLNLNLTVCLLTTVVYAFLPYHAVYAVTVWKDVLFSAGVLLFSTAMLRLYLTAHNVRYFIAGRHNGTGRGRDYDKRKKLPFIGDRLIYCLGGLMMCLLRSNGWYAFLISLPFLVYFFRRKIKLMLPLHLGIAITVLLIKGPLMTSLNVTPPDLIESLSVPLQQISYVIYNNRELTASQQTLIDAVIDRTDVVLLYHPGFADNMKELVRAGHPEYLSGHKSEYFKLWLELGLAHPADYLQAYINQTWGYWYPGRSYPIAENEGISPTDLALFHQPLISGPLIVKGKEIALKLHNMLPLYGLLWNMGTLFWFLLIITAAVLLRKERWKLGLILPGLAVMATVLIATPVADDFRYAYSLIYGFPLYLLLAVWSPDAPPDTPDRADLNSSTGNRP